MSNARVSKVVIVGGGTAGWMTAAALSRFCSKSDVSITLVESEAIGTVGVGEATIPQLAKFNAMLGIDEDAFVKATQATFKLGIEFVDWGQIGTHYFHPFGVHGVDLEGIDFHQYWVKARSLGEDHPLESYSLNAKAARAGKFIRPKAEHGGFLNRMAYAFHFDAVLYAAFLRDYAEARGVTRLEGIVSNVHQNPDTGFLTTLTLQDGRELEGDLFIDCTGFRGVLIEGALKAGYEDWSHYLPVNRAVAVTTEAGEPPLPFTRATAYEAGWQWRIPPQHRIGNGYVYSDQYIDPDQAERDFVSRLDGALLKDPKHLRFMTGRRKTFWDKNCVAIGLSAGFMEPLESTSIHLIQSGISKLIALFPDKSMPKVERDEYNRLLSTDFAHIRDFLILHYKATGRQDTPFWAYVQNMDIPDTLQQKLDLLKSSGRFFKHDSELFDVTSWIAVAVGQGIVPASYNRMVEGLSDRNICESLANMRGLVDKTVAAMPSHEAFIARYCAAQPVRMQKAEIE